MERSYRTHLNLKPLSFGSRWKQDSSLSKTVRLLSQFPSIHPLSYKVGFIKTFQYMWDGSAHLSIDRKKNVEIRTGTESTWKWRERQKLQRGRERTGGEKTFHLPCFPWCTDDTVKHQEDELLLRREGRKEEGEEGNCVVKWVCLKWKGEAGNVYMGSVKGLFW